MGLLWTEYIYPQNSHDKAVTPNVDVFGDTACEEAIKDN